MDNKPIIFVEGKSDWKHLKQANTNLKSDVELSFYSEEENSGDDNLLKICKAKSLTPNDIPHIFIFDRDNPRIIKEVAVEKSEFKEWGNKVYSLVLPIPSHRTNMNENICIEFYYNDSDLKIADNEGRRLYFSSEFDEKTGKHVDSVSISYGNRYKLKGCTNVENSRVLDSDVFGENKVNIALSKEKFAENILKATPPFDKVDFSHFQELIDVIKKIIHKSKSKSTPASKEESRIIPIKYVSERILTDNPPVVHIFVGRKSDLKKLEDRNLKVIAITGLGGEGKSTLAARYYSLASSGSTERSFERYAWSDFKDMDTPLHDKLLGIIEKITEGKESKERYADENISETIYRLVETLNNINCLVVLDNVDGFVDKDKCTFIGKLQVLFEELTKRLQNSLVIITCRSAIEDYHITFLEIPLRGLSFSETKELAQSFGVLGDKIDENLLTNIYETTSGHALWLNLLFAQVRSERFSAKNINEVISSQSGYLDAKLLDSIWNILSKNEKEIIWIISIFTRPPDLIKIHKASKSNFQKCRNIIGSLVRLRLVTEVEIDGETHYDLHPIIRVKAREACLPEKKRVLQKCVIAVLSFGDWKKLKDIVNISDSYTSDIDNYVECAEIAIENKDSESAIDYIFHVSEPLLKYGEDAKFIQLCKDLFLVLDTEKYEIGIHSYISDIFDSFICALLEQGENKLADDYLSKLNKKIKTISQFKYYSTLMCYNLWFQNRFSEALDFAKVAIKKLEEKGESVPSNLLYNKALASRDLGQVDEALDYFLKLSSYEKIDNWDTDSDEDISSDVGNISRCLYLKKQYKTSLELCKKSVKYLIKGQSRRLKINYGYGLLWLGDIYIKMKIYKEAEQNIKEAIDIWSKYCPARLKKINDHIKTYPKEFNKKYGHPEIIEKK